jgi:7,8-dihydro-6-hydroxymethylpterin dimethyltransferase
MSAPAAEACFSATRALCNVCGQLTDAKVVFRERRVHLVKWCAAHGRTEALVSDDLDWYLRSLAYVKPGQEPLRRAVGEFGGCPTSCGLCPQHQQHTCVPILEITDRCDLACPICLVGCGGDGRIAHGELALSQVHAILDGLVRYEGRINMLTLSGGEPTLHPELLAIVDAARRPEIGLLSLSTNGLRLLRDERLARELIDRQVVISLQLDGTRAETTAALRGRPELGEQKRRLVEQLLRWGARLSLTVTLARGVNEPELEGLLQLLFAEEQVLSMMVQPLAARPGAAPADPITLPTAVRLLAASSRGVLHEEDFTPLPCSHPSCFALTYLLKTAGGRLVSLPRILDADSYLDIVKNQALLATDVDTLGRVKDALYALWTSNGIVPDRDAVLASVKRILLDLNRLGRGASHRDVLDLGANHVKSVFIHHFMDRFTFDLSRAMKCCNHYPQPDGRLLPACVRNNLPASLYSAATIGPSAG